MSALDKLYEVYGFDDALLTTLVSASLLLDQYLESDDPTLSTVAGVLNALRENLTEEQIARAAFIMAELERITNDN